MQLPKLLNGRIRQTHTHTRARTHLGGSAAWPAPTPGCTPPEASPPQIYSWGVRSLLSSVRAHCVQDGRWTLVAASCWGYEPEFGKQVLDGWRWKCWFLESWWKCWLLDGWTRASFGHRWLGVSCWVGNCWSSMHQTHGGLVWTGSGSGRDARSLAARAVSAGEVVEKGRRELWS